MTYDILFSDGDMDNDIEIQVEADSVVEAHSIGSDMIDPNSDTYDPDLDGYEIFDVCDEDREECLYG